MHLTVMNQAALPLVRSWAARSWRHGRGGTVVVAQSWWYSRGGTVLVVRCWWHGAGGTVLVEGDGLVPSVSWTTAQADQSAAWLRGRPLTRARLPRSRRLLPSRSAGPHRRVGPTPPEPVSIPPPEPVSTPPPGGSLLERLHGHHRHHGPYEQIPALVARGQTITAIGSRLHLDRKTVRKFSCASSPEAIGSDRQPSAAIGTREAHAGRTPAPSRSRDGSMATSIADGRRDARMVPWCCSEIRALGYRGRWGIAAVPVPRVASGPFATGLWITGQL
jgi:hypothetical protein